VVAGGTPVLVHNTCGPEDTAAPANTAAPEDTSGTATVYLDAGQRPNHASISVTYGDETYHSEQWGYIGDDAFGREFVGPLSTDFGLSG